MLGKQQGVGPMCCVLFKPVLCFYVVIDSVIALEEASTPPSGKHTMCVCFY